MDLGLTDARGSEEGLEARRERRRAAAVAAGRRRRRAAVAGLLGSVVLAAFVLALVLPGDLADEPTIVQAADFTVAPATTPPPGRHPDRPSLLATTASGPAHPFWEEGPGWVATGERIDYLADRQAITVFYEREGQRVGYTIVEGPQLPPPVATTDEVVDGVRLRSFKVNGRFVVTWLRGGRTCILSGRGVDVDVLLGLAAGPERQGLRSEGTAQGR
jgi:hypothetical protein